MTDDAIALLDIDPIAPAHVLVIPRRHVERVYDLSSAEYHGLFELARSLVPVLLQYTRKTAVGFIAFGSGLPHAHLHLVPHDHSDELLNPRVIPSERERLHQTAEELRAILARDQGPVDSNVRHAR